MEADCRRYRDGQGTAESSATGGGEGIDKGDIYIFSTEGHLGEQNEARPITREQREQGASVKGPLKDAPIGVAF